MMSYYPTESRGGCMESLSRCCRQAYFHPVDTRKLLYIAGGVVGVLLVVVVWSKFSDDGSNPLPLKGHTVLEETPLIVGCNYFPTNLRDRVHNSVSKVKFNQNLKNDSVFGSANCPSCQTDLQRLQSGLVGSQIWSIQVPCDAMYKDAVSLTLEQVDAMSRLIHTYPGNLGLVTMSKDISESFKSKQVGSLLAVSSGHSLDGRLAVLRTLHSLGVRVMSITSDCSNAWASSYTDSKDLGLTPLGQALVLEMNRLGIVVDLSEASEITQKKVLDITKAPVIFSHAAAYNKTSHSRNIKDDVLELLKKNKGLLMVTFAQEYVNTTQSNATPVNISSVVDHINYIKDKIGVEFVGIGGEFDAVNETYPSSLSDVSTFPTLFDILGDSWTNRQDLKKLAGENLMRVLQDVEKVARGLSSQNADETFALPKNSSCYSDYNSRSSAQEMTTAVTLQEKSMTTPQATSQPEVKTAEVNTTTQTTQPSTTTPTQEPHKP